MQKSRIVIAHHLILTGYGHWLPNDPRGSGSQRVRKENLSDLGPVHFGRKDVQPPRNELRQFYRNAAPRLVFRPIWFDDAKMQAIGQAFEQVVAEQRYTVWSCAILGNHVHLCVRRHRDDALAIWGVFAEHSGMEVRRFKDIDENHPIWAERPYKVFMSTPEEIRRVIAYIEKNPEKEGLSQQHWPFVKPYDNWPYK